MLCTASSFVGTNILLFSAKSKSGLSRFNISPGLLHDGANGLGIAAVAPEGGVAVGVEAHAAGRMRVAVVRRGGPEVAHFVLVSHALSLAVACGGEEDGLAVLLGGKPHARDTVLRHPHVVASAHQLLKFCHGGHAPFAAPFGAGRIVGGVALDVGKAHARGGARAVVLVRGDFAPGIVVAILGGACRTLVAGGPFDAEAQVYPLVSLVLPRGGVVAPIGTFLAELSAHRTLGVIALVRTAFLVLATGDAFGVIADVRAFLPHLTADGAFGMVAVVFALFHHAVAGGALGVMAAVLAVFIQFAAGGTLGVIALVRTALHVLPAGGAFGVLAFVFTGRYGFVANLALFDYYRVLC